MPKIYESTATALTPKEAAGGNLFSTLANSGLVQQMPGLSVPSLTPNRDVMLSILKSRRVGEAIVQKFGLQERYRVPLLQDALKDLQGSTRITASKEGLISVTVEYADAALAAAVANAYLDELNRWLTQLAAGE